MDQFLRRFRRGPGDDADLDLERASSFTWPQVRGLLRATFRRRGYTVADVSGDSTPVDLVMERSGERVFLDCRHWQVWEVPDRAVHELAGYASGAGNGHHGPVQRSGATVRRGPWRGAGGW